MAEIEMMQGDWMCSKCNGHNFARRYTCFACGCSKDGTQGPGRTSGHSERRMEGDWKCSHCNTHNFARREQCFSCNAQKSVGMHSESPHMLKGDWVCSKCKEHNFARRKHCFGCNTPRFTADRPVQLQDGDWVCQKCREHNFARRIACFGCETRKEHAIQPGGAQFYRGSPMYASGHNSNQHPPPQQGTITQGAHQGSPQVPQRQVGGSPPQGASDPERDNDRQEDRRSRDHQSGGDDDGPHGSQDRSGSNNEPDDDDEDGGDDRLSSEGKGDGGVSGDGSGHYEKHTSPGTGHPEKGGNHPEKGGSIYDNDWHCSKCNELNFGRRNFCYACKLPKNSLPANSTDHPTSGKNAEQLSGGKSTESRIPDESESVRTPHFMSGDWTCNECNEHNFARRYMCFSCNTPKKSVPHGFHPPGSSPRSSSTTKYAAR